MSQRAALIKQADIARALRAAKSAGAGGIEIRHNGSIWISVEPVPDNKKETISEEKAPTIRRIF